VVEDKDDDKLELHNDCDSLSTTISIPILSFQNQLELGLEVILENITNSIQVPPGGFMDKPIIPQTILDPLDTRISDNAKYLIFDSISDLLDNLFEPHERYFRNTKLIRPTAVSFNCIISYLNVKLTNMIKKQRKHNENFTPLIQNTVQDFNNQYCKLQIYREKIENSLS
jgi:hypothetical protein